MPSYALSPHTNSQLTASPDPALNLEGSRISDFLWDNVRFLAPRLKSSLKMKKNPSICSWSPLHEEIRCNCAAGRLGDTSGVCLRGATVQTWHESVLNGYDENAGGGLQEDPQCVCVHSR